MLEFVLLATATMASTEEREYSGENNHSGRSTKDAAVIVTVKGTKTESMMKLTDKRET